MLKKEVAEPRRIPPGERDGMHGEAVALPEEVATNSGLGDESKQVLASNADKALPLDSEVDLSQIEGSEAASSSRQEEGSTSEIGNGLEQPLLQKAEVH